MYNIRDWVERFVGEGYSRKNAEARVCQDIILMAIANSSLSRNVTIQAVGVFEELNQQEYHGKRVNVIIRDLFLNVVKSKIDLGVHKQIPV